MVALCFLWQIHSPYAFMRLLHSVDGIKLLSVFNGGKFHSHSRGLDSAGTATSLETTRNTGKESVHLQLNKPGAKQDNGHAIDEEVINNNADNENDINTTADSHKWATMQCYTSKQNGSVVLAALDSRSDVLDRLWSETFNSNVSQLQGEFAYSEVLVDPINCTPHCALL